MNIDKVQRKEPELTT